MNIFPTINKLTDETGNRQVDLLTEDLALTKELEYKPMGNYINSLGQKVFDSGRLWGFDVNTADYSKLLSYFTDARVTKRSQSLICHVLRKIAVRFPNEMTTDKESIIRISGISREEFEKIQSEAKNDPAWFGEVGFQNMVRLDGSLHSNRAEIIKKHDIIKVRHKQ